MERKVMRGIVLLIVILNVLCIPLVHSQNQDELAIKQAITTLFNAMRKGDTATMRSCFDPEARLQTAVFNSKTQKAILNTESIDSFLVQVKSIRIDTMHIEERITHYDIKIDDPMASVWADYEFYLNEKVLHIGVDAFQLFKSANGWKIIQICDTRKRK
jgi:hypothetical protein